MNNARMNKADDAYHNNAFQKDSQSTEDHGFPNVIPSEEEQTQLVALCNAFKQNAQRHASAKKDRMRTCFAYAKSKFIGNDLLPIPSTLGSERDNNRNRPQIFIPLTRQQVKTIFSQLKLTIFPNDQDFFRVRAKTRNGVPYEDLLTEGLKYIFKEAMISEKIGACLYSLIWAGCFAALPCIRDELVYEWSYQKFPIQDDTSLPREHSNANEQDSSQAKKSTQASEQYIAQAVTLPPQPDLEAFNPLNFYIDPFATDPELAKWVYVSYKKCQEIQDSRLYFNKDKLQSMGSASSGMQPKMHDLNDINDFLNIFHDSDDQVTYDLYYFPHLKTDQREYRNMIVGVAGEQLLVRFHPNLFPKGLNPVVFCGWMHDTENPYSTGPVEDLIEIQKAINILWNYKLEVLARAGNRFAIRSNVDLSNFFGVAGGVAVTEDPRNDIVNFTGDYSEVATLDNTIGILKAEGQLVAGSQNPFQGSASLDYKKTATELQIIQENSISILREVIEHVSVMGVKRILERLMYLIADLYDQPVEISVNRPFTGREFQSVDFRLLKSGEFTIDLVSVNPSQSKQAQINGLMQLLEMVNTDPNALFMGEPIIEKIGELVGVKNIKDLLEQIKGRVNMLRGQVIPPEPESPASDRLSSHSLSPPGNKASGNNPDE